FLDGRAPDHPTKSAISWGPRMALKPASRGPAPRRCPRYPRRGDPRRFALLVAPPFPWLRPSMPLDRSRTPSRDTHEDMRVVTWSGGRVSTRASIAVAHTLSGAKLRDAYYEAVRGLTFGLAGVRDDSVVIGPVTLLRFGTPKVTRNTVDWPIEGGLLAGAPG